MSIAPEAVHSELSKRILVDGFDIVVDLQESRGSWMRDKRNGRDYLDFFSCFSSLPLGWNHPEMINRQGELTSAAINNISNSDLYTVEYADAVSTIGRIAQPVGMENMFFVAGGALAVENCLKAAMDWKYVGVNSSIEKTPDPAFDWGLDMARSNAISIGHFQESFHGRTGYTLSITCTDPMKTKRFSKHDWPRFPNPKIHFPLDRAESARLDVLEQEILNDVGASLDSENMAAVIIEPIQGEGGDNHFRDGFLRDLANLVQSNDALFIVDEVQSGVGATGKMWAHEHAGLSPDLVAFGKKMQICGFFAGDRLKMHDDNVLETSGRINSTWGGNLVDFVRGSIGLEVVEAERLVDNTAKRGVELIAGLEELADAPSSAVSQVRGKGTMCAFTLPTEAQRGQFRSACIDRGVFTLNSGRRSVRLRPNLALSSDEVDIALAAFSEASSFVSSQEIT